MTKPPNAMSIARFSILIARTEEIKQTMIENLKEMMASTPPELGMEIATLTVLTSTFH